MISRRSFPVFLVLLLVPCIGWPGRFPDPVTVERAPMLRDANRSAQARPCVRHLTACVSLCQRDHATTPRLFSWDDAEDPDAPTDLKRALIGVSGPLYPSREEPDRWSEIVGLLSAVNPLPCCPRIIALRC